MLKIITLFLVTCLCSACNCTIRHSPQDTSFNFSDTASASQLGWYIDEEGYIISGIQPNFIVSRTTKTKIGENEWQITVEVGSSSSEEIRDPLEYMPEFKEAFSEANTYAKEQAKPYIGKLGAIHAFWMAKQTFLEEKYKIKWKTPAELNEGHIFYD